MCVRERERVGAKDVNVSSEAGPSQTASSHRGGRKVDLRLLRLPGREREFVCE